jgi:site-specific DNA recombinase
MSKRRNVHNHAAFGTDAALTYEYALIYCRVSSEKQRIEGHGLDSQEHRCRVFAEQQGLKVERVFRDSFSGGGDFWQRPAMRELLEYVDARPVARYALIFDDMSRFARDTEFHLRLRREVDARQMKPLCPNFTFSDSPEGKFAEIVIAAKNEYERIGNRRQVIQKMKARMEAGYDPFSRRRGYDCIKDPVHGKIKIPSREGLEVLRPALEAFGRQAAAESGRGAIPRRAWVLEKAPLAREVHRSGLRAARRPVQCGVSRIRAVGRRAAARPP